MLLAMRIVLARVVAFNQQQIEKLFSNTSHQLLGKSLVDVSRKSKRL